MNHSFSVIGLAILNVPPVISKHWKKLIRKIQPLKTRRSLVPILFLLAVLLNIADAAPRVADVTFVAFDVETTGLSAANERIIEIGAVKYKDGNVIKSTSWLINPGRPIRNSFVHGITDKMVAGHPTFAEIYPAFEQFSEGCVLMAHNAQFDIRFMREELLRNNKRLPDAPVINSLSLFRTWFPDAPSHSLGKLGYYLSLPETGFHRAENDAEYILRIMNEGLKKRPGMTLKQLKDDAKGYLYFSEQK